ncbi:MAG: VOC family protein [Bacteroidia bacterium]|nr:VOC family protein [Bacteroidia bacterium]
MSKSSRVTGIGGVFFRVADTNAMKSWYEEHLGIPQHPYGAIFASHPIGKPDKVAVTNWSFFKKDDSYFPPEQAVMVNFRVQNLELLLKELSAAGVSIVADMETYEYGKFAWILDPEGNKIELWEPVDNPFDLDGENVIT